MTTEYLLDKEMQHVLAALTPSNALVMRVSLHTGLRVGDVLALKCDQISNRFWVTEAKTGKRRLVGLPTSLINAVLSNAGDGGWCFPHRLDKTRHRTRQAVWKDVKRAARAFRLPQNVGPHSARKCYAVDLLAKYGDIERVRRALKHRYTSTTAIYAMADRLLEGKRRKREKRAITGDMEGNTVFNP